MRKCSAGCPVRNTEVSQDPLIIHSHSPQPPSFGWPLMEEAKLNVGFKQQQQWWIPRGSNMDTFQHPVAQYSGYENSFSPSVSLSNTSHSTWWLLEQYKALKTSCYLLRSSGITGLCPGSRAVSVISWWRVCVIKSVMQRKTTNKLIKLDFKRRDFRNKKEPLQLHSSSNHNEQQK